MSPSKVSISHRRDFRERKKDDENAPSPVFLISCTRPLNLGLHHPALCFSDEGRTAPRTGEGRESAAEIATRRERGSIRRRCWEGGSGGKESVVQGREERLQQAASDPFEGCEDEGESLKRR
jgi:hypothetical protein